jgi:hypothetical protein
MSPEQLLLLLVLIGIPLVDRLFRAIRARTVPDVPHNDRPAPAPLPLELPPEAPPAPSASLGAEPEPAAVLEPAAPVRARQPPPPARHSVSRRRVVARGDLRRGVVLMAILGPCRAVRGWEAPDYPPPPSRKDTG